MKKQFLSSLHFWIQVLIGFSILLLCLVFSLAISNTRNAEKTFQEVKNSFAVLESLEETMIRIAMLESGTRGFVLFGEPKYLETYFDGEEYLSDHLLNLERLLSQDKDLSQKIKNLSQRISDRIIFYRYIIDIRNKKGFNDAQKIKKESNSHEEMLKIRFLVEKIQKDQHKKLEAYLLIEDKKLELNTVIISSGGLIAVILLIVCYLFLIRSLKQRKESERKLDISYKNAAHLAGFIQEMNVHLEPKKCFEALISAYPKIFKHTQTSLYSCQENENFNLIADNSSQDQKNELDQLPKIVIKTMKEVYHTGHLIHLDKLDLNNDDNQYEFNDLICIPLTIAEKQIGVLNITQFQSDLISDMVLNNIRQAAAHLALALRNSLLFEQVQALSIKDELTGLFNRRHFYALLKQEIYRSKRYKDPLCLVMLDIDYFKRINDRWGHQTGDLVLKKLSEGLLKFIRQTDQLFRVGGEEFCILLPKTTLKQAQLLTERMKTDISNIRMNDDISITVSMGISEWKVEEDTDPWLKRTDEALYAAKNQGRNRIVSSS
jgi:diguanylate cyclase (GGDEF)-like protein